MAAVGAAGQNPPRGVVVYYQLPEDLSKEGSQEVEIEVLDGNGEVLRSMSSQKAEPSAPNPWARFLPELARPHKLAAKKGMNRWVWDFRLPDAKIVDDSVLWGSPHGPEVPPGSYQVRMTAGDWSQTWPAEVKADPRLEAPAADYVARYELAKRAWQDLTRTNDVIRDIRDVRTQVKDAAAPGRAEAGRRCCARRGREAGEERARRRRRRADQEAHRRSSSS